MAQYDLRPAHPALTRSAKLGHPVRENRTKILSYNEDSSSGEESHRSRVSRPQIVSASTGHLTESESIHSVGTDSRQTIKRVLRSNASTKNKKKSTSTSPQKQRSHGQHQPSKRQKAEAGTSIQPTVTDLKRIPPWHTLPYHILLDIFFHASYPLVLGPSGPPLPSRKWLIDVALLCRGFMEPALAALYHTPVLIPVSKAHALVRLLSRPPETLSINYASKVQELDIDVINTLVHKSPVGYFDVCRLIEAVPHIKRLRFYHKLAARSFLQRKSYSHAWQYPEALFKTLNQCNVRLRSFEWDARFEPSTGIFQLLSIRHPEPSFKHIQTLHLRNITYYERARSDDSDLPEGAEEALLGVALIHLEELRDLWFTDCAIVNELFLPHLPTNLRSLTLDNCDEVTSPALAAFLSSSGSNLRRLVLRHNRHLNLSFLISLEKSCPKLEVFCINFRLIHDRGPLKHHSPLHFDDLLGESEIPTWPSTLQDIEMFQLRNWDERRATNFFTSLLEAAPRLKDLRRLRISVILTMGWRDRASYRKRWIKQLEKVFLRRSEDPAPFWNLTGFATADSPLKAISADHISRISARKVSTANNGNTSTTYTETLKLASGKRKSVRIAQQNTPKSEESDRLVTKAPSDTFVSTANTAQEPEYHGSSNEEGDMEIPGVQGMCDVVSVRIDNLRPAERMYNEADFIDDEVSGDEEWDGDDHDGFDSYAW